MPMIRKGKIRLPVFWAKRGFFPGASCFPGCAREVDRLPIADYTAATASFSRFAMSALRAIINSANAGLPP